MINLNSRILKEAGLGLFHNHGSHLLSYLLTTFCLLLYVFGNGGRAINLLLASIRYSPSNKFALRLLYRIKKKLVRLSSPVIKVRTSSEDALNRSIVLSNPEYEFDSVVKKGVLLLTFTHTFTYFLKSSSWNALNERYIFVLEPSWSGYADQEVIQFIESADDVIVQATEITDRIFIKSLYPSIPVLDIGASNWVNYTKFSVDKNVNKDIDAIYIANNNPIKRVYRAIEVFVDVERHSPGKNFVIICAGWGGKSEVVNQYLDRNGFSSFIKLLPGMPQKDLVSHINKAKCSVLFSLKEGSNRVLFESMFCDVPVFCIAENVGVNKSYINEYTGVLAYDHCSVQALSHLIKNFKQYKPREWAMSFIKPELTTHILEDTINMKFGERANLPLKIKINDPEVSYLSDEKLALTDIQSLMA